MKINFDRELITKCQTNAPRYTSYPTADRFSLEFDKNHIIQSLRNHEYKEPISLYIHMPFCNTLCLFCACNKIITNDRSKIKTYISYLEREIKLYFDLIGRRLEVIQLHFGGGTPSWLSPDEIDLVMEIINKYFDLSKAKEIAIEIDPRYCATEFMHSLKRNGFNRVSIGLQDFDHKVQKTVNRVQTYEQSKFVLDSAKELGFTSTNVDLIYGLPHQSLESFSQTIEQIITLNPDRIALFNYAHIPNNFMPQTRIKEEDLPEYAVKLDILQMSVEKLLKSGYEFIGMDHFAKAEDELTIALNNGSLQRNFQGYSTFGGTDMLSFGVSSIGYINHAYYQNVKDLDSYYRNLDNNQHSIMRGFILNLDDLIRKQVISEIMCKFSLNWEEVSQSYAINAKEYFMRELSKLDELATLGLIKFNDNGFSVTDMGRFLIRNVAMVFDHYLALSHKPTSYSKVI